MRGALNARRSCARGLAGDGAQTCSARSPCLSPVSMMAGAELVSPVVAASGPFRDGGGEAVRDSESERRAIVIARGGNP